ncbi:phosphatase PAP2 family protein [Pediococcus claussenii]|uniref:PAP2 superfamily protein n=1 Tax=Pediococcus claussenii (strain ATCC BAA-344 / DSM 14800 / JCM 18046 / KCTC 3811 / LMG 21948 / P06) TaxID=701521 RepID=G8PBI9_PEDCP|nr:phosphatase PAP2 family protein [Pediococcus claussenii]AEV94738.1 PAP2 superfamily protein [Pediococcus claussenii ATCC BAA-344]ANZ69934.1 hypothetical protein AYR57_06245 [Pediococcus claussenii]ANZ71750.1 hypothetical protein AYR58_06245 [Pediococcus claussenii]KRN20917.1 hypothetical protein IV79_GL000142 [Pediococcus claussenii]
MEKSYKLNYKNTLWIIITIISIGLFIGMMLAVMQDRNNINSYDLVAFRIFKGFITSTNTSFFSVVSFFGSPEITFSLVIIVCVLLWFENKKWLAFKIFLLQFSGDMLVYMIKNIVRRPRPGGQIIIDTGFSFPSGHMFSTSLLGLAIVILLLPVMKSNKKKFLSYILIFIWMALVGISRVYLKDHYFSDVLASLFLSIGYIGIFDFMFNCIRNKFKINVFGGI